MGMIDEEKEYSAVIDVSKGVKIIKVYMGQIMSECDCTHHGCETRGYCMAERIDQLVATNGELVIKLDEVERRRARWMYKSDVAEAKLAKAVELIELAVELARFDLNPKLCDDMIDFVTDLELEKPE